MIIKKYNNAKTFLDKVKVVFPEHIYEINELIQISSDEPYYYEDLDISFCPYCFGPVILNSIPNKSVPTEMCLSCDAIWSY